MCFSATTSFATAALLAIIGALTLRKVKHQKQIFFALIPAFFAAPLSVMVLFFMRSMKK